MLWFSGDEVVRKFRNRRGPSRPLPFWCEHSFTNVIEEYFLQPSICCNRCQLLDMTKPKKSDKTRGKLDEERSCIKCHQDKSTDEFYKSDKNICKECKKAYSRDRYVRSAPLVQKHREKLDALEERVQLLEGKLRRLVVDSDDDESSGDEKRREKKTNWKKKKDKRRKEKDVV
jgi:hypothetical protein